MRIGSGRTAGDDFSTERELLYKILFDMRSDINDLKRMVGELMQVSTSKASVLLRDLVKSNHMIECEPVKGKSGKVKAYMVKVGE